MLNAQLSSWAQQRVRSRRNDQNERGPTADLRLSFHSGVALDWERVHDLKLGERKPDYQDNEITPNNTTQLGLERNEVSEDLCCSE